MALEHLNSLPQTPSLRAYLQHTRTLASSLTHAWDLPSLLIKPVQRLLKYSLLLTAIIDGTPDGHEDKESLKIAKEKMDQVARGVNEGRRRREVVKEVLTGNKREDIFSSGSSGSAAKAKKKGLNIGVAASISMGKMRGIGIVARSRGDFDGNEEKEQVDRLERELKRCDSFIRKFAKDAVQWGEEVKEMMSFLSNWTQSFGRVIGISDDQVSESFDAFKMVIDRQIPPLCEDLELVIQEHLLRQLATLVDTTLSPSRLLEAMHTLEPLHYGLLNVNVSKSRPPPALLEASQSYIALRGQLFAELPKYLELLHKGIIAAILQLGLWQSQFWGDVRERWSELWEALRVDGEMNVGSVLETVRIWWDRFSIIDSAMNELGITKKFEKSSPLRPRPRQLLPQVVPTEPKDRLPTFPTKQSFTRLHGILSALEPSLSSTSIAEPQTSKSFEFSNSTSQRKGTRRFSDASRKGLARSLSRASKRSFASVDGLLGHSPTSPKSDTYFKSKEDQLQVSPIQRQFSDARLSPTSVELPPLSPRKDYLEIPHQSPKRSNARRRMTDTLIISGTASEYTSDRRSPTLPSLTRSRSFGFRSSSPTPRKPRSEHTSRSQPPTPRRSSFLVYTTPVMYECEAVTSFSAGRDVRYEGIPFHQLEIGRRLGVLQEAGHPYTHPNLPIHVDDGEDCLLMATDTEGTVGWAFASFLIPVD
jgi:dynamin-binding protein